jgi:hypothetical protein
VLPIHIGDIDQLQVGFMNKGSSLDRVSGAIILHEAGRDAAKFVINPGRQFFQSGVVSSRPSAMSTSRRA